MRTYNTLGTGFGACAQQGSHMVDTLLAQEAVVLPPCIALSLRPKVGRFLHCKVCADTLGVDDLSIANYQKVKERLASAPLPRNRLQNCAILSSCAPCAADMHASHLKVHRKTKASY